MRSNVVSLARIFCSSKLRFTKNIVVYQRRFSNELSIIFANNTENGAFDDKTWPNDKVSRTHLIVE